MKQFFKYVLATIVGMLCLGAVVSIFSFVMMGIIIAADSAKPSVQEGTVLRISLNGSINERAVDNPFTNLLNSDVAKTQGLDDILKAIKVAKDNKNISGIYLEGGALSADYATAQELRRALLDFKKSKKFVLAYADNYATFAEPKQYVTNHLADALVYADGVRAQLRALSKQDKVNFISPDQLAKLDEGKSADGTIAVYYAQGDIVDQVASNSLTDNGQNIVGSKVVQDLDQLANDDDVKAVVLRINSGGGSAYASEQMWRAVQSLKMKKPVVVSMSGMAASGGYYMSCGADYIVAEPTTLTGSIGIFGMIPDMSGLMTEKLGLHFDVVKTNKSSDFGAMGRPFNADEANAMQNYVNRGYKQFISRVAAGRHMTPEQVDRIGQGRVWTGNQALAIKLVDKLGSLDDAIAIASQRAKLQSYNVMPYPAKVSWIDQFMDATIKRDYMEEKMQAALGEYYAPLRFVSSLKGANAQSCLQARVFYVPNLK